MGCGPHVGPFPSRLIIGSIRGGRDPPPTNPSHHLRKKGVSSISSGCSRKVGEGVQPPSPPPPHASVPPPLLAPAIDTSPSSPQRRRPQAVLALPPPPDRRTAVISRSSPPGTSPSAHPFLPHLRPSSLCPTFLAFQRSSQPPSRTPLLLHFLPDILSSPAPLPLFLPNSRFPPHLRFLSPLQLHLPPASAKHTVEDL